MLEALTTTRTTTTTPFKAVARQLGLHPAVPPALTDYHSLLLFADPGLLLLTCVVKMRVASMPGRMVMVMVLLPAYLTFCGNRPMPSAARKPDTRFGGAGTTVVVVLLLVAVVLCGVVALGLLLTVALVVVATVEFGKRAESAPRRAPVSEGHCRPRAGQAESARTKADTTLMTVHVGLGRQGRQTPDAAQSEIIISNTFSLLDWRC